MESERPSENLENNPSITDALSTGQGETTTTRKRRNHRGGKKKRNRRQSFAAPGNDASTMDGTASNHTLLENTVPANTRPSFYRLGQSGGRNLSETSLDAQALLDHRYAHLRSK